ncbi:MAG TPA: hypothetical protein DCZ94_13300 [Lentisphaeria bacterium]|nr:hypothetical protein [Lentisphaeria bacterium]
MTRRRQGYAGRGKVTAFFFLSSVIMQNCIFCKKALFPVQYNAHDDGGNCQNPLEVQGIAGRRPALRKKRTRKHALLRAKSGVCDFVGSWMFEVQSSCLVLK